MCLLTKLDEALILYKRKSGGPSSLVRRIIGGTREEDARHFLGKMKKMSFSLEKKEKNVTLHSKDLKDRAPAFMVNLGLRRSFIKRRSNVRGSPLVDNIGVCEKRTLSLER